MVEIILFLACAAFISLAKTYRYLARSEDHPLKRVRRVATVLRHEEIINVIFRVLFMASFTLLVLDTAFSLSFGWAFLASFLYLCLFFIILPKTTPRHSEIRFAEYLSKPLAYLVTKGKRPLVLAEKLAARTKKGIGRSEPLSREAINTLLSEQINVALPDAKPGLIMARQALDLGSTKAGHFLIKRQKARFVTQGDEVGPVLLSELHENGRKIFPVEDKGEITGVVKLDALSELKAGGKAKDVLIPQMVAVNINEPANQVIKRFVESAAELVFAENDIGEVVGVIYLEDIIKDFVQEPAATLE